MIVMTRNDGKRCMTAGSKFIKKRDRTGMRNDGKRCMTSKPVLQERDGTGTWNDGKLNMTSKPVLQERDRIGTPVLRARGRGVELQVEE